MALNKTQMSYLGVFKGVPHRYERYIFWCFANDRLMEETSPEADSCPAVKAVHFLYFGQFQLQRLY
jgi:hypothetical protein